MAKRGRKRKLRSKLGLKPSTISSVLFIFLACLAVLSIFSFLQLGPIPTELNRYLVYYFGFGAVFVPFLLLLLSFYFSQIKTPFRRSNVSLGFSLMFCSVLGGFEQGKAGEFIWLQTSTAFSPLVAFIVFFFLFVVGFVVLFDTSVLQIVRVISKIFGLVHHYLIGRAIRPDKKKPKLDRETVFQSSLEDSRSSVNPPKKDEMGVVGIAPSLKSAIPATQGHSTLTNPANQIWQYPPISLFDDSSETKADRGDVRRNAQIIEQTLDSFGITARVNEVNNSPSVTQYALEVALGTKLAKIVSLSNDLAMALSAPGGQIRVEAPIPGRPLVGIEVPNRSLEVVPLRKILSSEPVKTTKSKLVVPLGLDVAGNPRIADITKMPHVLIAGQTGSGKSVCINSWLCTLLFRASPSEVRLIMVDPKRVELTPYNGIPHLLCPVIVEPEKVVSALKWAVSEMELRYKKFTEVGAKNIESYNNMAGFQSVPYIIIFIDELAEIMLFSPAEVEDNVCRLAQMARAVGIHLVLATQRPSVNIITGLIKANIPTRLAFAVASMTDSRVILDAPGAEKLLGRGDMLYIPPDLAKPVRIQGCFVSDRETTNLIDFLKQQPASEYNQDILSQPVASPGTTSPNLILNDGEEKDVVFAQAVDLIKRSGKASASLFQRHLKLGYARAARLLDQLEKSGIVGPGQGAKPRQILIPHTPSGDTEF